LSVLGADPVLFIAAVGLLGLIVGSFLNVVIHRLPLMLEREWRTQAAEFGVVAAPAEATPAAAFNLVTPRSACPACKTPIRAIHNVPVLSWLWLRGQCAHCQAPISARYPVVELLTAVLSALVAWPLGPTAECVAALGILWALIALTGIDLDHQLLPDLITIPLLWAGLAFHLWRGEPPEGSPFATLGDGVAGALAGYLSLWLVYHGFRLATGKEGMGYGDFKLFAALGAWMGWQLLPLIILLSAATGAVVGITLILLGRQQRENPIPFGPFLAAAGLVALLYGQDLVGFYWNAAAG
jgi:leader peptidase (prepilin peptidase) / N-methyltransferase